MEYKYVDYNALVKYTQSLKEWATADHLKLSSSSPDTILDKINIFDSFAINSTKFSDQTLSNGMRNIILHAKNLMMSSSSNQSIAEAIEQLSENIPDNFLTGDGKANRFAIFSSETTLEPSSIFFINTVSSPNDYKYLRNDGTWAEISAGSSYNIATTTTAGLVKPYSVIATPTINNLTSTSGRYYHVQMDSSGKMFVNIPWTSSTVTGGGISYDVTDTYDASSITIGGSGTSNSFRAGTINAIGKYMITGMCSLYVNSGSIIPSGGITGSVIIQLLHGSTVITQLTWSSNQSVVPFYIPICIRGYYNKTSTTSEAITMKISVQSDTTGTIGVSGRHTMIEAFT